MHARAGFPAEPKDLINVEEVINAYRNIIPDPSIQSQRVVFGTSGHRGTSLKGSFNEAHIQAISLAIAEYRATHGITGPLFLGSDTHPLSAPAEETASQVLTAAGVRVITSRDQFPVPTPALSHAILSHNSDPTTEGLADGIIVTPSHNPPQDGGFKYNPPHGGPADTDATDWIASRANELLEQNVVIPREEHSETEVIDFMSPYVESLPEIVDIEAIRQSPLHIAAHPLGGAATAYWAEIARVHGLNIEVLGPGIDPTWSFMTLDWDGQIRMDPSSSHVMKAVLKHQANFDLIVANDADADRFGIITREGGLQQPNHVLSVAIDHLLRYRTTQCDWPATAKVGKTLVSSAMIDRVVWAHESELFEVPVGFKWFVPGLHDGSVVFGGEESAGASFLRMDGTPWSTDKDGIVMCLLAAEIMALTGESMEAQYKALTFRHGDPAYTRVDAAATPTEKARLKALTQADVTDTELAGDPIVNVRVEAPGNEENIGGVKVETAHAWFAARPSGTEDVYKVYAESFKGEDHLAVVLAEAQELVQRALNSDPTV